MRALLALALLVALTALRLRPSNGIQYRKFRMMESIIARGGLEYASTPSMVDRKIWRPIYLDS